MLTVTINKIGAGTGTVTSTPAGISCGSTCQASYAYATAVTLSAAPDANQYFIGWDSTACTGMGTCVFTITSNTVVRASFSPPPNIVFTTSTTQTAALGGLAGADAICAQRALAAGLAGTYRAWLSTSTVNAIDRLGSASGWVRPDGKPVLNNVADIAKDKLFYPPRLDEFGNDLGAAPAVITATLPDGTLLAVLTTCGDFTSAIGGSTTGIGYASACSGMFTAAVNFGCAGQARIYCFGIDRTAQVAVTPVAGRRAFTTVANWTPGGGIGSADSLCQNEATAAKLPGTYKALLASSGASAASRFDVGGAPWIRSDGIRLAPTASAFFSASMLDASPNVTADGSVYFGSNATWSGATTMTTAGSDATTCADWLSTSGTGTFGAPGDTSASEFFGAGAATCGAATWARLTCLQE
jgi:Collagenase NC10 and Endostatin.